MTKYLISRGYYAVDSIIIEAADQAAAIAKAKQAPEQHWKDCGGEEPLYQIEDEITAQEEQ